MKSHRNISKIIKNMLTYFGSDKPDRRWRFVLKGRGLLKNRPKCPKCKGPCSLLDTPRHLYSLWSCSRTKCKQPVVLCQESHFLKCPFCYGKDKLRVRCSICKGRGWTRI